MIKNEYHLKLNKVRKLLIEEKIFYYGVIIVSVMLLFISGIYPLIKGGEFNPSGNVPWWIYLIYILVELALIILTYRLYKIIKKFNLFVNHSIDAFKHTQVLIDNNYIIIVCDYKQFKSKLNDIYVYNYIFNCNRKNPLWSQGFVKLVDKKTNNVLLLSSLIFDYFVGSSEAKNIFEKTVNYKEISLNWSNFNLGNLP
jgi:hypothetical protein